MTRRFGDFDIGALYAALDAERRSRGITWVEATAEINKPFDRVPSIPIHVSTLRGMREKRAVASGVVLQILRWLDRTPETFILGRRVRLGQDQTMPDVGPARILRFDTKAIHAALDAARAERGLTWKQVASELPGFRASMLTNLATVPLVSFPQVMRITQWLGRPAANFMRGYAR